MRLAADANVLLAAVLGGRARLILTHPKIETVFTAENIIAEVEEYAQVLAPKKRLRPELLLLAVAALPVTVVPQSDYRRHLSEARRRMAHRDLDDVDLLALAMFHNVSIWSNDRDFEGCRVELFTTERLLRKLAIIR